MNTMSAASLVLFDCDGTLVRSLETIVGSMQKAFIACDLQPPTDEAVKSVIGLSLREAIDRLGIHESCDREAVFKAYRQHYLADETQLELFPGVRDCLDTLRMRGYWLGIVTGKSRAGLDRVLARFDLQDYFLVSRTADCCPSKPHPAMVLECMAELGVSAGRTTVIGDAEFDMFMARAAGAKAIGVSFGVGSHESLMRAGARAIVDTFPDLLEFFPTLQTASDCSTMGRRANAASRVQ